MNKQQDFLARACSALSLNIKLNFEVRLKSGQLLRSEALVEGVGPSRGMLVFSSYEDVAGAGNELMELGFGYSVYGPPRADEMFDLDSYREMFLDWSGAE
jgi:hypothetical protein